MKKIIEKTFQQEIRVCDSCGKEDLNRYRRSLYDCCICNRELCGYCEDVHHYEYEPITGKWERWSICDICQKKHMLTRTFEQLDVMETKIDDLNDQFSKLLRSTSRRISKNRGRII